MTERHLMSKTTNATTTTTATTKRLDFLRTFLSNYTKNHLLQSERFYIRVLAITTLIFALFYLYGYLRRLDPGLLAIAPPIAANIILLCMILPFSVLAALRPSRQIAIEYGFFILAIWIGYSVLVQDDCLCCINEIEHMSHKTANTLSILDLFNHLIGYGNGLCNNQTTLQIAHGIWMVLLTMVLYMLIIYDADYFALAETAKDRIAARYIATYYRENQILAESNSTMSSDHDDDLTINQPTTMARWMRVVFVVVVLLSLGLPFIYNNATLMSMEEYFMRIGIFNFVLLVRLVNSYNARYNISKLAITYEDLVKNKSLAIQFDPRFEPIYEQIVIDVNLGLHAEMADLPPMLRASTHLITPQHKDDIQQINIRYADQLHEIRLLLSNLWFLQHIIDISTAAYALVVPTWFLVLVVAQVCVEFTLLWYHIQRYIMHLATTTTIVQRYQQRMNAKHDVH